MKRALVILLLGLVFAPQLHAQPGATSTRAIDLQALAKRADAARKRVYQNSSYEFCHDSDHEEKDDFVRRELCPLATEPGLRICPELERLCVAHQSWKPLNLPEGLLRTLLVLICAVPVLVFLLLLVRRGAFAATRRDEPAAPEPGLGELPERAAIVLIREADNALRAERVHEAAHLTQLAFLRHFDDTGLVPFLPSRTSGEYLRALRAEPQLATLYRSLRGETERMKFGDGLVDRQILSRVLEQFRALLGLLLLALLVPASFGCGGLGQPFFSHEPDGLAAFRELLSEDGIEVSVHLRGIDDLPEQTGLVVLRSAVLDPNRLNPAFLDPLLDQDLSVLLVDDGAIAERLLPVTSVETTSASRPALVHASAGDFCGIEGGALGLLPWDDKPGLPPGRSLTALPRKSVGAVSAAKLELVPMLEHAKGGALWLGARRLAHPEDDRFDLGCLLVLADAGFIQNVALTREANARLTLSIVRLLLPEGKSVVLLERIERGRDAPTQALGDSPLFPFIVQSGVWVAALFLALGAAFGRLRDPARERHLAFIEHVQAVGRHYRGAGVAGLRHAAGALSRLVASEQRIAGRGRPPAKAAQLAAFLAAKHGVEPARVERALAFGHEDYQPAAGQSEAEVLESLALLSTLLAPSGNNEER